MSGREERKEHPMHNYGDCSFCGGKVKEEVAELDYRYKGNLYVFREVPAGVCQQCGEKYLIAGTAKAIEREIRTRKEWKETVSVPVITFSKIDVSEDTQQVLREQHSN
jgi:YgiT-type zinc finger domain-containing protein